MKKQFNLQIMVCSQDAKVNAGIRDIGIAFIKLRGLNNKGGK